MRLATFLDDPIPIFRFSWPCDLLLEALDGGRELGICASRRLVSGAQHAEANETSFDPSNVGLASLIQTDIRRQGVTRRLGSIRGFVVRFGVVPTIIILLRLLLRG